MNLILEEIYGNMATVYHYSPTNKTHEILHNKEWKFGKNAGNMYGPGVYTCFKPESTNPNYGGYLYKFHVKGIQNFFIFLPEYCNKVNGTHFKTVEECIEYQNKKFNLDVSRKGRMDFAGKYRNSPERKKVGGIVFEGEHDGFVCIVFDPETVIPVELSRDEGKTWEKITKNKNYNTEALKKGGNIKPSKIQEYKSGTKITRGSYSLKYLKIDTSGCYVIEKNNDDIWEYYPEEGKLYHYKKDRIEDNKQLSEFETIKTMKSFPDWVKGRIRDKNLISVVKGIKMLEKEDARYNKEKSDFEKQQEDKRKQINKQLSKISNRRLNELMPKTLEDWLEKDAKFGPEKKLYPDSGFDFKTTYKEIKNFSADFVNKSGTDLAVNGKTKDDIIKRNLSDITDELPKENRAHTVTGKNGIRKIARFENGKVIDLRKNPDIDVDKKYGYRTRAFLFNTDGAKYIFYMKDKEAQFYPLNKEANKFDQKMLQARSVAKYVTEHGESTKSTERSNAKWKNEHVTKVFEYPDEIKVNDWLSIKVDKSQSNAWSKEKMKPKLVGTFRINGQGVDVPHIHCIDLTRKSVDDRFDNMYCDLVDEKHGLTEKVVKEALYKIVEYNVKAMKYMKENNMIMKDVPLTRVGRDYKKKIENYGRVAVRNRQVSVNTESKFFNY